MYYKISVDVLGSSSSTDFSPANLVSAMNYVISATKIMPIYDGSAALTTGTTIDLGSFTTVTCIIIYNKSTANYLTAEWTNTATSNKQSLYYNAAPLIISGATVANDLKLTGVTTVQTFDAIIFGT